MDLIYEGITTSIFASLGITYSVRMDLSYEGITTLAVSLSIPLITVRMDLIYEGITTRSIPLSCLFLLTWSEWTWFTKGLRLIDTTRYKLFLVCGQNGPDLRRDYDFFCQDLIPYLIIVRMDLIYEGITTQLGLHLYLLFLLSSEWTWFTKGLRPLNRVPLMGITR